MPSCGDLREVTANHPELGDFKFLPKSDEEHTYDLGGYRSADEMTGVDGGGRMIDKMNRQRWSVEFAPSWDANNSEELEALRSLAEHPVPADWTFNSINGVVYGGTGKPVGNFTGKGNEGTLDGVKISGGGKLAKISG